MPNILFLQIILIVMILTIKAQHFQSVFI